MSSPDGGIGRGRSVMSRQNQRLREAPGEGGRVFLGAVSESVLGSVRKVCVHNRDARIFQHADFDGLGLDCRLVIAKIGE